MGSFNVVCGITNTTITPGEEAVLFFISSPKDCKPVLCHTSQVWKLASFPVRAIYDDYGTFSIDETQGSYGVFLDYLKENVEEMESDFRSPEISPDTLNLDIIQKSIIEGRLKMGGLDVDLFIIRKEAYDQIMESRYTIDYPDVVFSKKYFLEGLKKDVQGIRERFISRYNELDPWENSFLWPNLDFVSNNFEIYNTCVSGFFTNHIKGMGEQVAIEKYSEVMYLMTFLNSASFTISPSPCGHQDDSDLASLVLNTVRCKVAKSKVKERQDMRKECELEELEWLHSQSSKE